MEQYNIALMKACEAGNLADIEKALDAGAYVNHKDRDNYNNTPLIITSFKPNIELSKMLISRGGDVTRKNGWGFSPLHIASQEGNIELAKLLIYEGANVNDKNDFEHTPLRLAVINGHKEMVKLLLSKGATIDKDDIRTAERKNRADIVEILDNWPQTMALATLQEDPMVYNYIDHYDMIDLNKFIGKKGKDFGGRRRTNKRRTNKRRTNKRKTNKRR
jgi:ankyrin repeat protein